uniref:Uncharacterized protein n=1 Tax=Anguilla anguilla TaxID=7936 RepID=A0A0E9VQ72_ANGAN
MISFIVYCPTYEKPIRHKKLGYIELI